MFERKVKNDQDSVLESGCWKPVKARQACDVALMSQVNLSWYLHLNKLSGACVLVPAQAWG